MVRKNKQSYFEDTYKWSLEPVKDISFSLYSSRIWKSFCKYISDNQTIIDLGCGAGVLLYNIKEKARKYKENKVIGFDFSDEALYFARCLCPDVTFQKGEVIKTKFSDSTFDIVASTMTIEHVDDEAFLKEVSRIIKPQGVFLLTTVMKKPGAIYYLKNEQGEIVLELTHLREYAHPEEIVVKLHKYGFRVILLETPRIKFSLLDFILCRLSRTFKLKFFSKLAKEEFIVKLRKLTKIPIPGYFAIEIIAQKN